ncbi:MAG: Rid family detoxifying hydrolase [Thermoleophilia bacterium]|nr:Rid family detoxifying hydrolase [Thermoleophilia bacterium]
MASLTTIVSPELAPPGGWYSFGIATGDLVFCAGAIAVDQDGKVVGGTVGEQTKKVIENLEVVLKAAGSSLDRVVKTLCFLVDIDAFAEFNEAYAEMFGSHYPARSTVAVAGLVKDALVEIECIAVR